MPTRAIYRKSGGANKLFREHNTRHKKTSVAQIHNGEIRNSVGINNHVLTTAKAVYLWYDDSGKRRREIGAFLYADLGRELSRHLQVGGGLP